MHVRVHNPSNNTMMFEGELSELLNVHADTITLHHAERIVKQLYLTGRYIGTVSDAWIEITCHPVPHWLGGINIADTLRNSIKIADAIAKRTTDGSTRPIKTQPQPSDDVH